MVEAGLVALESFIKVISLNFLTNCKRWANPPNAENTFRQSSLLAPNMLAILYTQEKFSLENSEEKKGKFRFYSFFYYFTQITLLI